MVTLSPLFTPVHSLIGGVMLSASVHTMLSQLGTVLGISGFAHATVASFFLPGAGKPVAASKGKEDPAAISDRTAVNTARLFTAGLLTAGLALGAAQKVFEKDLGVRIFDPINASWSTGHLALIGVLVGLGTKLGSGCTSGHFLCGLSRVSPRSIVATAVFFSVAVVTHLFSTEPVKSASLIKAIATAEAIRLPVGASLGVMQIPALIYGQIVPLFAASETDQVKDLNALKKKQRFAAGIVAFMTGMHFGFGLALTGMLRPSKVLGFLALSPQRIRTGEWDPSLAMVAIGGILPASLAWFVETKPKVQRKGDKESDKPVLRHASPLWRLPKSQVIDAKLVGGAALFGVGWGLSGFCPGPILANFGAALTSGQGIAQLTIVLAALAVSGQIPALLA